MEKELRIGNYYLDYQNKIGEVDLQFFVNLSNDVPVDDMVKSAIDLCKHWLVSLGFEEKKGNVFDITLRKKLFMRVVHPGTESEAVYLINETNNKLGVSDCALIREYKENYGLKVHNLQNLIYDISGKDIKIKPLIYRYDQDEEQCRHERQELHECPFRSEIHQDFSLCSCCDKCMDVCYAEI